MRRIRLISLKSINDKSTLNFDLTGLLSEKTYTSEIKLPSGTIYLNHSEYLNKMKVYDDGNVFFIMCTKRVDLKYAKEFLMKYAIERVGKTLETLSDKTNRLTAFKERLEREIIAA